MNPQNATVGELYAALRDALDKTLGASDLLREARMADVGSAFLAMQDRLQTLWFVDARSWQRKRPV